MAIGSVTLLLLERIGLILVVAFVLTRTESFRTLLRRTTTWQEAIVHSVVFGSFAIALTTFGMTVTPDALRPASLVWHVESDEVVISLSLVAVTIASILGGPFIGFGAGVVASIHYVWLGSFGAPVMAIVHPIAGLLVGASQWGYSRERYFSPVQTFLIGMIPPVVLLVFFFASASEATELVRAVKAISVPFVVAHGVGVALFMTMIGIVVREQESEAAEATAQALAIVEEALPHLKEEDPKRMAEGLANLLYDRLGMLAVTVTDDETVLAQCGIGHQHTIWTPLAHLAVETNEVQAAYTPDEIECPYPTCPLKAAVIVPISSTYQPIRFIKLYFSAKDRVKPVDLVLARGIRQLVTNELNAIGHDKMARELTEAKLNNLQAQIHPHFLFNTLHLLASLNRTDPDRARYLTIQLANYMRFTINIADSPLVSLTQEIEQTKAYVAIIQARFQNRLTVRLVIDERIACDAYAIPPSTIQPLIENAVQHGLARVSSDGCVTIRLSLDGDDVVGEVSANGVGFSSDVIDQLGQTVLGQTHGLGVYNVNMRLVHTLGEASRLSFENGPNGGAVVSWRIPKKEGTL